MAFIETPKTISLVNFRKSVMGSWINFLQNDISITTKTFPPDGKALRVVPLYMPDSEEGFGMPVVVIHRLKEEFVSARLGNYYETIQQIVDGEEKITTVSAYRLNGMYQFDLLTRDLPSQFDLTGYLDNKFIGSDKYDDVGNVMSGVKGTDRISFMVKDLSKRTTLADTVDNLPDTDIHVIWRPYEVKMVESFPPQKEIEQVSYTVEFWCDMWYAEHDDQIVSISVSETRM